MSVTEPPPEMEVEVRSIWWVAVAVCLVSVFFFFGGGEDEHDAFYVEKIR